MRVDGAPNIMTCAIEPKKGMRVERQNVVLSSKMDLLRATDWFFPDGMNHHEIFAGVPGVQSVMAAFARRVSGLGELPERVVPPRREAVRKVTCEVLVVGGGPAGLCVAAALAREGANVALVDEGRVAGGSLLSFPRGARVTLGESVVDIDLARAQLVEAAQRAGVSMHACTALLGVLEGDDWLAHSHSNLEQNGLVRFEARAHVVATGGHDGVAAFVGNDLPGVVSARAAGRLLRDGVLIGERLVVTGKGPFLQAFVDAATAAGATIERVDLDALDGVRGMSRVRTVVVREGRDGKKERHIDADALVVAAPVAPAFEIAASGGAPVEHDARGYHVVVDDRFRAPGVERRPLYAIGEAIGASLDLDAMRAAADRIARAITEELAR